MNGRLHNESLGRVLLIRLHLTVPKLSDRFEQSTGNNHKRGPNLRRSCDYRIWVSRCRLEQTGEMRKGMLHRVTRQALDNTRKSRSFPRITQVASSWNGFHKASILEKVSHGAVGPSTSSSDCPDMSSFVCTWAFGLSRERPKGRSS